MRPSKRLSPERLVLAGLAVFLACIVVVWAVRMSKTPPPRPRPTWDDVLNSGRDVAGAMKAVGSNDPATIAGALEVLSGSLMDDKKCEAVVRSTNLAALTEEGWGTFQLFVQRNWWSCRWPVRDRLVRELAAGGRAENLDGVLPRLTRVAELGAAGDGNRDYQWPTSVPRERVEQIIKSLEK